MKKDWEIKKLGDICETGSGGTPLKGHKEYYENGTIPWLRSGEVCKKDICESELFITETGLKKSSAKLFPINTVLVAMYGATAGQTGILRFQSTTNQAVCGILPNSKLVPEFIYYFFLSYKDKLIAQAVGGAQPNISQVKICNSPIPVPPLEEQIRIVKILDEKFAQLETIKTNAQTNLQNTKDLFQSQLTKALSSSSNNKVVDLFDIKTGKLNSNAAVPDGKYPFFTCSREVFAINTYAFDCDAILLAGNNASGDFNVKHYCGKFNAYQRTYVITVKNSNETEIKLLYYVLENYLKQLKNMSVGANTRFLKLGMIQNLEYPALPLPEQKRIVKELDTLSEKVRQLQEIYTKQIANCDELKQAYLQKAFEGEL